MRDRHGAAAEILEDDDRASLAKLGLGALERALERLGPEAPPTGLELELEVQDALGGREIQPSPDLLRVGGRSPVAEHHRERGGAALIRLLGDEGHGGDQVALAKEDFERKKRLFERGVITRSVLVASETNYLTLDSSHKALQARIAQLNQQLGKTRIIAQIPGTVVATHVSEGEFVAPGVPVVSIEDMKEMLLEGDVSDRDVVRIQVGQAVEVRSEAFPGRVFASGRNASGSSTTPSSSTKSCLSGST